MVTREPAWPLTAQPEDGPVYTIDRFVLEGAAAWGLDDASLDRFPMRVDASTTGWITAVGDVDQRVRRLGDLANDHRIGPRFHRSALDQLEDRGRFSQFFFDVYGIDYADLAPPELVIDEAGGVARLVIAGPGVGQLDLGESVVGEDGSTIQGAEIDGEPIGALGVERIELIDRSTGEAMFLTDEEVRRGFIGAEEFLGATARLYRTDSGYVAARPGWPGERVRLGDLPAMSDEGARFYDSALQVFSVAIASVAFEEDLRGVGVRRVDPRQLRDEGVLTYEVLQARIGDVRTVTRNNATGEESVNPEGTQRFLEDSPVSVGDPVDQQAIDEYVYWLNRHPRRRFDVALSPGPAGDEATVDYYLTKQSDLSLYAQLSNTGTEETSLLRQRFGLAHYNLTGVDDILSVDYITGNFDDVHGVFGSYERPLFGIDRLRGRVFASYVSYDASEVGVAALDFSGDTYGVGGELTWTAWQHDAYFLDLIAGLRYENVQVESDAALLDAENDFLLANVGARLSRQTENASLSAGVQIEWNLPDVADTDQGDLDELGRLDASDDWTAIRWDVGGSFYLEQLFAPDKVAQGEGTLAHEIFLLATGFNALGDRRLPPNYAETVGGLYSVRGYPESFLLGDQTLVLRAEYRFHIPRALGYRSRPGKLFGRDFYWAPPRPLARPDWDLVLRGFVDAGWSWNNERLEFENNAHLLSVGAGIELSVLNNLIARLDLALPLRPENDGFDDEVETLDARLHFVVTVIF